ncbi:hypothetical protein ATPR_0911 [Acetobacter tropicalis NBRC 101654]|uniref:Uncharacterized protein n=1 Tax=Acetobacter tropicalis NBRC 101654 TaxID=749388 RepID=F7VC12_9PROT|nr:hypothetical protein ATPR_0911 [Acetobacter tropicalis NBRC 101654]
MACHGAPTTQTAFTVVPQIDPVADVDSRSNGWQNGFCEKSARNRKY